MGPMSAQLVLRCPTTVSVCGLPRWEGTWPQPGRYRHRFNSCLADSGPKAQWRCTRRRIRFGWCSGQHRACEDPLVSLNLAAGSSRLNLAQEGVASEVSGRPFESDLQGHRPGGGAGVAGARLRISGRVRESLGFGPCTSCLATSTARSSIGRTAASQAADAGSSPARVANGRSRAPRSVL
jgi:hypothetical protein